MRKLDVKEIHGYDASEGLKLVRPEALAALSGAEKKSKRVKPATQTNTTEKTAGE
jgi:arginine decarboxylase